MFVFNVPPTAKVMWGRGHGLKSHPADWRSRESTLRPLVYKASGLSTTPQRLQYAIICTRLLHCTIAICMQYVCIHVPHILYPLIFIVPHVANVLGLRDIKNDLMWFDLRLHAGWETCRIVLASDVRTTGFVTRHIGVFVWQWSWASQFLSLTVMTKGAKITIGKSSK